jgi:hypothetical protein
MQLADEAAANHHIILREYAMEKSIDSAVYSMMAAKQRMVVQLLMGEVTDFFEDPSDAISMGMAEIAARAIGDPTLIRRVELDREIRNLEMEYSGFEADVSSARETLRRTERAITEGAGLLASGKRFEEEVGKIGQDKERETVWEFGGQVIDRNKPENAEKGWKAPKLMEALDLYLAEESAKLANSDRKKADVKIKVDGVTFNVEIHQTLGDTRSEKQKYDDTMAGTNSSKSAVGEIRWVDSKNPNMFAKESFSGAQSMLATVSGLAKRARGAVARYETENQSYQKQLPSLRFRASQEFGKQDELNKLRAEMREVEAQLAANANPTVRRAAGNAKNAARDETPANFPGAGLAPQAMTLGSSEESTLDLFAPATAKPASKPDAPIVLWGRKPSMDNVWMRLTDNISKAEVARREKEGWEVLKHPKNSNPGDIEKPTLPAPAPAPAPAPNSAQIFSDDYTGPRYTYGLRNRPLDMGTAPKGYIIGSDGPAVGRARWGTIQYPRQLTPDEIYNFELEVMEEPNAAPTKAQPDLFTATRLPDAAAKLGQVRVGTMNALGAYRTLTAKREKLGKLTAKEEQQLLDAEVALGQKLAFDMDALKAAPARAYPQRTDNIFSDLLKMIRPMSFDNEATRMVKNVIWTAIDMATDNPKERAAYKAKFSKAILKGKGTEVFDKRELDRLLEETFAYDVDLLKEAWNIESLKTKTAPPDMRPAIERSTSRMDYSQMEMSRYGETDRKGQLALLSSAEQEGDFSEEKAEILKNAPRDKDGHLLAPNGKRSNLTEDQWATVRTGNFKRWFGDWEAMANRRFLDGEPIAKLTGEEFQKVEGESVVDRVSEWYAEKHSSMATNTEIGDVILDRRGVKDSWSHGHGKFKASAFAAVPDVIAKGRIIDRQKNWKGRNYDTVVIAAPIRLGDTDRIMTVVVEKREKNRFYLHEAYLKENLQNGLSFKTGTLRQSGAQSGDVETMLHGYFEVNPETVSKVVDGNGEPLVVYHGTDAEFDTFDRSKARRGFFFTSESEESARYAAIASRGTDGQGKSSGFFLNVRKPDNADLKSSEQRGHDGFQENDMWVTFSPNQIKSATDNNGEFSSNPSILSSSAEEDSAAVEKALSSMKPIHRAVFESVNSGMTPEQVMAKYSISSKAVSNILDQVRSRIASVMKATTADGLTPAMRDGKFDGGRPDLALSTIPQVAAIDQIRNDSGLPEARENRGANILSFKTLRMTMNDTMCRGRHGVSHQKWITAI